MICQTVPLNFLRLGLAQLAMTPNHDPGSHQDPSFWVEWPLGWEIEELGPVLGGQGPRKVLARSHETHPESAAIELTFAPRVSGDATTAADALGDSLDYLGELLTARGFQVEMEPGCVTTLGGLPAVEARLRGVSPTGRCVRQWNVIAFGDTQAYSLSFTGTADSWQRHMTTFCRLRSTMLLA